MKKVSAALQKRLDKFELEKDDILFLNSCGKCKILDVVKTEGAGQLVELLIMKDNSTRVKHYGFLKKEIIKDKNVENIHYPIVYNVLRESYWRSVGFLARHATLKLRTTPGTVDSIVDEYQNYTGCSPETIEELFEKKYIVHNPCMTTFSDNASILFVDPPKDTDKWLVFPENKDGKQTGELISNKRRLFHNRSYVWSLFMYGFRAGSEKDHDINAIREHLQYQKESYKTAFEEGYNYNYAKD